MHKSSGDNGHNDENIGVQKGVVSSDKRHSPSEKYQEHSDGDIRETDLADVKIDLGNVRRSSRQKMIPSKFSDYELLFAEEAEPTLLLSEYTKPSNFKKL